MKNTVSLFLLIILSLVAVTGAKGQGERKAIIFTGIVVDSKTTQRLPNTNISIPKINRGTLADQTGYFSIPVFPGDSVVFGYVGFKRQYHVIPRNYNNETYFAVVSMREDVQVLAEVTIYPYSSEEEFKKAFLEMRLPDQADRDALAKSTDVDYINRMAAQVPNNAATNYRYTMDQYMFGRESAANKGFATTFPFLNPFAWAKFIKGVKDGDLKEKEWRKDLNRTPVDAVQRKDLIEN